MRSSTMEAWTRSRILQIAPDPSCARAGEMLANPRAWEELGHEGTYTWGLCLGSGSKPYQVRLDAGEPAFKCSCPSRKFPCKHAIGLMLLMTDGKVPMSDPPGWVTSWIEARQAREHKESKSSEAKAPDEQAQNSRRAQRLERVADGLVSLSTWMKDLISAGIAQAPSRGHEFFASQARRLVDAQAPGAARSMHRLSSLCNAQIDWQRPFLAELGRLHLLVSAFSKRETLSQSTRDDLYAAIGIAQNADDVLKQSPLTDTWQIIAQEKQVEDRLTSLRTWLHGAASNRIALILHFAYGNAALDATLHPGMQFTGDICFYPGNDVRALVKDRRGATLIRKLNACPTFEKLGDQYSNYLARQPWLDEVVLLVAGVRVHREDGRWHMVDRIGYELALSWSERSAWIALAVSGGHPVDLIAAFDGVRIRPMALFTAETWIGLTESEVAVA